MNCDEVQDILAAGKKPLSLEKKQAAAAHVSGCAGCREDEQTIAALQRLFEAWEDVPMPAEVKLPLPLMPVSSRSAWLQWVPLVAAAALVLMVVGQVQLKVEEHGWSLSFGKDEAVARLEAQLAQLEYVNESKPWSNDLAQAMALQDESQDAKLILALSRLREDERAYLAQAIQAASLRLAKDRKTDMETLNVSWQEQRIRDLRGVDQRLRILANYQKETTNSIYNLANYMETQPAKPYR